MKFTQPSHQCDERVTYHRWGAAGAISKEENLVHTARSYILHLGVHIFFFVPLKVLARYFPKKLNFSSFKGQIG